MRHYAIYAVRWPERVPSDGTPAFLPTPREHRSTTPAYLSQKNLATLNHKLSHAASSSRSASHSGAGERRPFKRQRTEEAETPPSPKRQKVAPLLPARGSGGLPKNKVGMSTKARELLGVNERRSGRARVPSLKLRESEPPPKGRSVSSSNAPISLASTSSTMSSNPAESSPSLNSPQGESYDRHLRSSGSNPPVQPVTPVAVKSGFTKVPTPKSLAVASQPRESNGRFGKKASTNGRYMRKNFGLTARGRRVFRTKPKFSKIEGKEAAQTVGLSSQKRGLRDEVDTEDGERGKRLRMGSEEEVLVEVKIEGEEGDLSATSNEEGPGSADEGEPQRFRRPLLMGARSGPGLFSRPNPLTFARRKWISSAPSDDLPEIAYSAVPSSGGQISTDDDAELPGTPAEDVDRTVDIVDDEEDTPTRDDDADVSDDSTERVYCRPKLSVKPGFAGPLTFKPNPLNMARRRWGPTLSSPDGDGDPLDSSQTKPSSHASTTSLTDLFEAGPDEAFLRSDDGARSMSSEEVSLRALL